MTEKTMGILTPKNFKMKVLLFCSSVQTFFFFFNIISTIYFPLTWLVDHSFFLSSFTAENKWKTVCKKVSRNNINTQVESNGKLTNVSYLFVVSASFTSFFCI